MRNERTFRIPVVGAIIFLAAISAGAFQRDLTDAKTWIERLERPDRIPGLRIDDVIARLKLKNGDIVADIGAGSGAFSIPFAKAVAPGGKVLSVDIWHGLLDYIMEKARKENVSNIQTVLAAHDNPNLPANHLDVAFFHDVFHNVVDRQGYLKILAASIKPGGRIVIIEQEFDDPIAKKWDTEENRITKKQVDAWMNGIGFRLAEEHDIFQGANNPKGAGMPERWFVVYARRSGP